jgi:hypothetical protein
MWGAGGAIGGLGERTAVAQVEDKATAGTWKPPANHHWHHLPIGKGRFAQTRQAAST